MKIVCTNLALRFYTSEGWTKEILQSCLINGEIKMPFIEDASPYYISEVGSVFDIDLLMKHCTEVHRVFNDYPHLSDKEFLTKYNW